MAGTAVRGGGVGKAAGLAVCEPMEPRLLLSGEGGLAAGAGLTDEGLVVVAAPWSGVESRVDDGSQGSLGEFVGILAAGGSGLGCSLMSLSADAFRTLWQPEDTAGNLGSFYPIGVTSSMVLNRVPGSSSPGSRLICWDGHENHVTQPMQYYVKIVQEVEYDKEGHTWLLALTHDVAGSRRMYAEMLSDLDGAWVNHGPIGDESTLLSSLMTRSMIPIGGGNVFAINYGDGISSPSKLMYSTNGGAAWTTLMTVSAPNANGPVGHSHGGAYDAAHETLYLFFGDGALSSIAFCDNLFGPGGLVEAPDVWKTRWGLDDRVNGVRTVPNPAYNIVAGGATTGSPVRTVDLVFKGQYGYYADDRTGTAATGPSEIYKVNLATHVATSLGSITGTGWFGLATSDGHVLFEATSYPYPTHIYHDVYRRIYEVTESDEIRELVRFTRADVANPVTSHATTLTGLWEFDGRVWGALANVGAEGVGSSIGYGFCGRLVSQIDVPPGEYEITGLLTLGGNTEFTGSGSLVLSGGLGNSQGWTITKTGSGTLTLRGAEWYGPGAVLRVEGGTVVMGAGAGSPAGGHLAVEVYGGEVDFVGSRTLGRLEIGPGGRVQMGPGADVLVVDSLALLPAAPGDVPLINYIQGSRFDKPTDATDYWLAWSGVSVVGEVPGVPWTQATAYGTGRFVVPIVPNGFRYESTSGGTTGSVEPAWPTVLGAKVTDGSMTWQCVSGTVAAEPGFTGSMRLRATGAPSISHYCRYRFAGNVLAALAGNYVAFTVRLKLPSPRPAGGQRVVIQVRGAPGFENLYRISDPAMFDGQWHEFSVVGYVPAGTAECLLFIWPAADRLVGDEGDVYVSQPRLGVGTVPLPAAGPEVSPAAPSSARAVLDLGTSSLIIHYDGASPLAQVAGWLRAGFTGGPGGWWDGPGIQSSAAANEATYATALGVLDNADPFLGGRTRFAGEALAPDGSDLLVRYTWWGDIDFDGQVTLTDYSIFLYYFFEQVNMTPDQMGWWSADLDYDGTVTLTDYNLLLYGFLSQTGPMAGGTVSAVSAPERVALTAEAPAAPAADLLVAETFEMAPAVDLMIAQAPAAALHQDFLDLAGAMAYETPMLVARDEPSADGTLPAGPARVRIRRSRTLAVGGTALAVRPGERRLAAAPRAPGTPSVGDAVVHRSGPDLAAGDGLVDLLAAPAPDVLTAQRLP